MERKQKRSGGLIFVIFGLLLVAAALALVMYNIWDSERAYKASMEILDEMEADGESPFIAAELAGDWQDTAD